jgi:hypothetical protein
MYYNEGRTLSNKTSEFLIKLPQKTRFFWKNRVYNGREKSEVIGGGRSPRLVSFRDFGQCDEPADCAQRKKREAGGQREHLAL